LKDEINILNELRHQHIIRLYDVFEEAQYWYLVTEKMTGGELFDRIVSKSYYNEKEARDVCKILFEAVGYCHSKCVAHRDLKPENLLLRSEDSDSDIKIADFGFAKKVLTPNSLTTQCGTPGYVAPEILEGIAYGKCYVACWAVSLHDVVHSRSACDLGSHLRVYTHIYSIMQILNRTCGVWVLLSTSSWADIHLSLNRINVIYSLKSVRDNMNSMMCIGELLAPKRRT
jgi:serine/threonine protein kinase